MDTPKLHDIAKTTISVIGAIATVFMCVIAILARTAPQLLHVVLPPVGATAEPDIVYITQEPAPPGPTPSPGPTCAPCPTVAGVDVTCTPALTCPTCETPTPSPVPEARMSLPFEDTFNEGPRPEWEVLQGTWRMVDGAYGTDEEAQWSYVMVGDPGWQDYGIEVDVAGRHLGTTKAIAFFVRTEDLNSGMRFDIDPWSARWVLHQDGAVTEIAKSEGRLPYGSTSKWVVSRLKVEVQGTMYSVYLNGQLVSRIQDDTFASGRVGLATYRSSDKVRFDNFVVTGSH